MAYTRLQRSINARAQLRDRKGRWITMFGPVKFLFNGLEALGRVVDIDNKNNRVTVQDSNGIIHYLSPKALTAIHAKGTLSKNLEPRKASLKEERHLNSKNLRPTPQQTHPSKITFSDNDSNEYVKLPQATEYTHKASELYDALGAPRQTLVNDDKNSTFSPDVDLKSPQDDLEFTSERQAQVARIALAQALTGTNSKLSVDSQNNFVAEDVTSNPRATKSSTQLSANLKNNPLLQALDDNDWRDALRPLNALDDNDIDTNFPEIAQALKTRRDDLIKWGEKNVGFTPTLEHDDKSPVNADIFTPTKEGLLKDPETGQLYEPTTHSSFTSAKNAVMSSNLRRLADTNSSQEIIAYRDNKLTTLKTVDPTLTSYVSAPQTADDHLKDLYAVDAWLDSRGYTDFNTRFDKDGRPFRVDFSGDLSTTPSGAKKKNDLSTDMKSFTRLRNPDSTKTGLERAYEDITDQEAIDSLKTLSKITNNDILEAVDGDTKLAQALQLRRDNAIAYANSLENKIPRNKTPNTEAVTEKNAKTLSNLSKAPTGSKVTVDGQHYIKTDVNEWNNSFTDADIQTISQAAVNPPRVVYAQPNRERPSHKQVPEQDFQSTSHLAREGHLRLHDTKSQMKNGLLESAPRGTVLKDTNTDTEWKKTVFGKWKNTTTGETVSTKDLKNNEQLQPELYIPENKAQLLADTMARKGSPITNYAIDTPEQLSALKHASPESSFYNTIDPQRKFVAQEDGTWLAPNGGFVEWNDKTISQLIDQDYLKERYGKEVDGGGGGVLSEPTSSTPQTGVTPSSPNLPVGSTITTGDGTRATKNSAGEFRDKQGNIIPFEDAVSATVPSDSIPDGSRVTGDSLSPDILEQSPIGSQLHYGDNNYTKDSQGVFRDNNNHPLTLQDVETDNEDYLQLPSEQTLDTAPKTPKSTIARPSEIQESLPDHRQENPPTVAPESINFGADTGETLSHEVYQQLSSQPDTGFVVKEGNLFLENPVKAQEALTKFDIDPTSADGQVLHTVVNKALQTDVKILKTPEEPTSPTAHPAPKTPYHAFLSDATRKKDSGFFTTSDGFIVTDYDKAYETLSTVFEDLDDLPENLKVPSQKDIIKLQNEIASLKKSGATPTDPVKTSRAINDSDTRARINTKLTKDLSQGVNTGFDMSGNELRVSDPQKASQTLRRYARGVAPETSQSLRDTAFDISKEQDLKNRIAHVTPTTDLTTEAKEILQTQYRAAVLKGEDLGFFFDKENNLQLTDPGRASKFFQKASNQASGISGHRIDPNEKQKFQNARKELKDIQKEASLLANPDIDQLAPEPETPSGDVGYPSSPEVTQPKYSLQEAGIKRTEPVKLTGESHPPTREQQDIIDAVAIGQNVSVQATAGSGKTSTIAQIARRLPEDRKALYLAFNKSVAEEAKERMPNNTEAMTAHSLAYNWAANDPEWGFLTDKLRKNRNPRHPGDYLELKNKEVQIKEKNRFGEEVTKDLSSDGAFNYAKRIVDTFQNSDRDEISIQDIKESGFTTDNTQSQDRLLQAAQDIWADYINPQGELPIQHDTYRKIWAQHVPDLSKETRFGHRDVLFLDESQDTPPVLDKLLKSQKNIQKIIAGDSDQAIYNFSGTRDFFENDDSDISLPLTESFRFGPEIAQAGNSFLDLLKNKGDKPRYDMQGVGPQGKVSDYISEPDAVLVRKNASIFPEVVKAILDGKTNIGVPTNTRNNLVSLVDTSLLLKGKKTVSEVSQLHPDLKQFNTWDDVVKSQREGNKSLDLIVGLLNNMSDADIFNIRESLNNVYEPFDRSKYRLGEDFVDDKLFRMLKSYDVIKPSLWKKSGSTHKSTDPSETKKVSDFLDKLEGTRDFEISTAHKSKGLEWDRVQLAEDFPAPDDISDDELKLLYVASTRGKREVGLGSAKWIRDTPEYNKRHRDTDSESESDTDSTKHIPDVATTNPERLKKAEEDATKCSIQASALTVDTCPYGGDTGFTTRDDGTIDVHDSDRAKRTLEDLRNNIKKERDEEKDEDRKRKLDDEDDSLSAILYALDDEDDKKNKKRSRLGINPVNHLPWGNFPNGMDGLGMFDLPKFKKKNKTTGASGTPNLNPNPMSGTGLPGTGTPNPMPGVGTPQPWTFTPWEFSPWESTLPESSEFFTPSQVRSDLSPHSWIDTSIPTETTTVTESNADKLVKANADKIASPVQDTTKPTKQSKINSDVNDLFPDYLADIDTETNTVKSIDTSSGSTEEIIGYKMAHPYVSKMFKGAIVDRLSDTDTDTDTDTVQVFIPSVGIRTVSSDDLTAINKVQSNPSSNLPQTSWREDIHIGDTVQVLSASSHNPTNTFGASSYKVLGYTPDKTGLVVVEADKDKDKEGTSQSSSQNVLVVPTDSVSSLTLPTEDVSPDTRKSFNGVVQALESNTPEQRSLNLINLDEYATGVSMSDTTFPSVKTSIKPTAYSYINPENVESLPDKTILSIDNVPYIVDTSTKGVRPLFTGTSENTSDIFIPLAVTAQMIQTGSRISVNPDTFTVSQYSDKTSVDLGKSPSADQLASVDTYHTISLPPSTQGGFNRSATKISEDMWRLDTPMSPPVFNHTGTSNEFDMSEDVDVYTPYVPLPSYTQSVYTTSAELSEYLASLSTDSTPVTPGATPENVLDVAKIGSTINLADIPLFGITGVATRISASEWEINTPEDSTRISHSVLQDYVSNTSSKEFSIQPRLSLEKDNTYLPGTVISDIITGESFTVTNTGKFLTASNKLLDKLPTLSSAAFTTQPSQEDTNFMIATGAASTLPVGTVSTGITGVNTAVKIADDTWEVTSYLSATETHTTVLTDNQLERLVNSGTRFNPAAVRSLTTSTGATYVLNQTVRLGDKTGVIVRLSKDSDAALVVFNDGKTLLVPIEDLNLGTPQPTPMPNPTPRPSPKPNPQPHFTESQKRNDSTLDGPVIAEFPQTDISKDTLFSNMSPANIDMTKVISDVKEIMTARIKKFDPNSIIPSAHYISLDQVKTYLDNGIVPLINTPATRTTSRGDIVNSMTKTVGDVLTDQGYLSPDESRVIKHNVKSLRQIDWAKGRRGRAKGTPYRRRLRFHQSSYYDKVLHLTGNIFVLKGTDSSIEPVRKDSYEAAKDYLSSVMDIKTIKIETDELTQFLRKTGLFDLSHMKDIEVNTINNFDKSFDIVPESFYANTTTKSTGFIRPDGTTVKTREELRTLTGSILTDFGYVEAIPGMDITHNTDPQYNDIKLNIRIAAGSKLLYNGNKIILPRGSYMYIDHVDAAPDMDTVWVEIVPQGWLPPQLVESK